VISDPAGARRDDYFARVCSAVEYADEHLGEDLRLEVLAEVACFSPRHFHRVFTSLLGETPDDCVRRLRLQKAAGLVLRRDAPTMTEIAQVCGFSTSALFSRNFARRYGASPTEWRDGIKRQAKVKHRQVPVASGKDPLTSFRYLLGEDEEEVAEVDTLKIEPLTVYCVPYLQGYNEGVGDAFSRLARWARPRGFLTKGSRIVAIPFDNPATTSPQRCRNYAGVIPGAETGADLEPGLGVVRPLELAGGTYLRASTNGSTTSLHSLHSLYLLLYQIAIPELGYASFGDRSFIEYPEKAVALGIEPFRERDEVAKPRYLVHVRVRPAP
jgi:AraC family transcriptional regulator